MMAWIFGIPFGVTVLLALVEIARDWQRPRPNRSKEHMAWLREDARREGRYQELGD